MRGTKRVLDQGICYARGPQPEWSEKHALDIEEHLLNCEQANSPVKMRMSRSAGVASPVDSGTKRDPIQSSYSVGILNCGAIAPQRDISHLLG